MRFQPQHTRSLNLLRVSAAQFEVKFIVKEEIKR